MVSIGALWLPILVAAVFVFILSSIIHMVLKYHQSDFAQVPSEDAVMDALRGFSIPPGEYVIPRAATPKDMKTPDFIAKAEKGPVAFFTMLENGIPSMTGSLIQWFVYCLVVGVFAGYVTGEALGQGARYLDVFQISGTVAFAGYGLALVQGSIWYKRAWSTTAKSVFDALLYALLTAGTFGWLWP